MKGKILCFALGLALGLCACCFDSIRYSYITNIRSSDPHLSIMFRRNRMTGAAAVRLFVLNRWISLNELGEAWKNQK